MKEVFAPHLGRTVKLGRSRPPPGKPKLKFGDYVQPTLPPPPSSVDYTAAAMSVLTQIFMNDTLGDCVIAALAHIVGLLTGNAGNLFTYTQAMIIAAYSAIGGYVPGDPSTDNGCDELTALQYVQSNGFADGTKLSGFLALDATNQQEVMQALFLFENLFFGVELPDAWINPFPSAAGFTWDVGSPDTSNGHAFCGVGYNAAGVQIDTWGLIGTVTWAAVQALCAGTDGGQLYVLLSPDIINKASGKGLAGFDFVTLQMDMAALSPRGGVVG
jgi:hypothetical protein